MLQNIVSSKGTENLLMKQERAVYDNGGTPQERAVYDNGGTPQNMEVHEYLLVEPAGEVNEKGTREKNNGSEDVSMDDNEKIEVDSDEGSFAEEDWNDPEQKDVPK